MFKTFLAMALLALPTLAQAKCAGEDLRQTLAPDRQAQMQAQLAQIPFATGNRWVAHKGDRTIDLVGTYHLTDPRLAPIASRLDPVIAKADAVLFEVTVADQKVFEDGLAKDFSPILITSGPTLLEMMSPEAWEQIAQKARAAGIPPWMASKMRPWFLSVTLAIPPCLRQQKAEAANGLDKRVAALAEKHAIPQVSLETVEQALSLFNKHPLEQQVKMLEATIAMVGANPDDHATTAAAYFDEKGAEALLMAKLQLDKKIDLPQFERDQMWGEFIADMLDGRNLAWMPHILTHPGDNIVVAVGAAHLFGENGLLNLLQQDGYTVEQLPF